ncbi:MFS transporter [Streptomyces sp. NBC_01166]|uniref:MFS transporter n=1 Tax=Streptomyces sp. NBC_01166 TaxID=2903755 RepID=UPI0038703C8F|nr:MFS transporter [Streptomyces sp. NBC_01166]
MSAVTGQAPADTPPKPVIPRGGLVLTAACLGLFMSFIEVTAAISTLRALQVDMHVAPADLSWVSSTYTLVVAACVLSGGALGERFGRRRVFVIGVVALAAGSLVVATASGFPQVLVGRAISGVGGALVLPTSLAIITTTFFVDLPRMLRYITIWVSMSGVGLAVGPLLGGALLDRFDWPAVYLVNAPLAVVTVAVTLYAVKETKVPDRALDLPGQFLSVVGLGTLVYGIAVGGREGYGDPVVVATLVVAVVALTALVLVERRAPVPMLDVRMMASVPLSATLVVAASALFTFVGVVFLEVLFLQRVQGTEPMATGLKLLPAMVAFVLSTLVAQRIAGKVGPARLLAVGSLVTAAAAIVLVRQQPDSAYGITAVGLALLGLGSGLVVAPSTAAAFAVAEPAQMGAASNAVTAFRQVGSVLATAVLGSVLAVRFIGALPDRLDTAHVPPEVATQVVAVAREGGNSAGRSTPEVTEAVSASFNVGIHTGLWVVAGVSALAAVLAFAFISTKKKES